MRFVLKMTFQVDFTIKSLRLEKYFLLNEVCFLAYFVVFCSFLKPIQKKFVANGLYFMCLKSSLKKT